MKKQKYIWVINGDYGSEKVFRFPCQVRRYAKRKGFSVFDETCTRFDMIVFCRKDEYGKERGFYALRYEIA